MRKHLIAILKRLLAYLESPAAYTARVKEVMLQAEGFLPNDKIDGYRKRSWVLNTLIAEFPNVRVRDLAFAIEQVMQEF